MATFNGWNVITMPTSPAPKSIEPSQNYIAGDSTNPFTGQQQVYDWGASFMELSVTLPPMAKSDGQIWAAFFVACQGTVNVFQLPTTPGANGLTFASFIPAGVNPNGYWRMKSNTVKWSVTDGVIYGAQFEIRAAI